MKHFVIHLLLFFLSISPFLIRSYVFFLTDPPVWPDEAIFVDTVKTLNTTGNLATNIFGDTIPGLQVRANWYPPLYYYLLSGWTQMLGTDIVTVRWFSFILSIGFFITLYTIFTKLFPERWLVFTGMIMTSLDMDINRAARIGRMDMLDVLFITLALYFFVRRRLFFCGVASALATLTHPFGFIAPTVCMFSCVVLDVWHHKRIRIQVLIDIFLITAPVLFAVGIWFLSMRTTWDYFVIQYYLQILRKAPGEPYPFILFRVMLSWKILLTTYTIAFVIFTCAIIKDKALQRFLIIWIGLVVSIALIVIGKENWFMVYVHPWISIILIANLSLAWKHPRRPYRIGALLCVAIVVAVQLYLLWMTRTFFSTEHANYDEYARRIHKVIPAGSNVILLAIPDPYFGLTADPTLSLYEFPPVPVPPEAYKKLMDSMDIAVANQLPDEFIVSYIKKNAKHVIGVGTPRGYHADVNILVPRNKRK